MSDAAPTRPSLPPELRDALDEYEDASTASRRTLDPRFRHEPGEVAAQQRTAEARAALDAALLDLVRDAERLNAIEADLDDMRWRRPAWHPDGVQLELEWFVGDGDGSITTVGSTFREAIDTYLAAAPEETR